MLYFIEVLISSILSVDLFRVLRLKKLSWGATASSSSAGNGLAFINVAPVKEGLGKRVLARKMGLHRLARAEKVAIDLTRVSDEGDDPHLSAAGGTAEEGCCEFASNPSTAFAYRMVPDEVHVDIVDVLEQVVP